MARAKAEDERIFKSELDKINNLVRKEIVPGVADSFFKNSPLLEYMKTIPVDAKGLQKEDIFWDTEKDKVHNAPENFTRPKRCPACGADFSEGFFDTTCNTCNEWAAFVYELQFGDPKKAKKLYPGLPNTLSSSKSFDPSYSPYFGGVKLTPGKYK